MKKLSMILLTLGLARGALAGPYSVRFERPLTLNGESVIKVEQVFTEYDRDTNRWEEVKVREYNQNCTYKISIEGRDIAVDSPQIGEHYFGSMNLECESRSFSFSRDFKTKFSRVLFLGVRSCVQSDTVVDNDYCNLTAIALRKETDMRSSNGDLFRDDERRRRFHRISSSNAKNHIFEKKLLPAGVITDQLDSFQVFQLSIGKNGQDFFIKEPTSKSNFAKGRNHYLNVNNGNRDIVIRNSIEEKLEELYGILGTVEDDPSPASKFKSVMPSLLPKMTTALRSLIEVISPVEFFGLERKLKEFEKQLIEVAGTYNPNVTNRDSFTLNYATQFSEFRKMLTYLGHRGSANSPAPPATNTPPDQSLSKAIQTLTNLSDPSVMATEYKKYYRNNLNISFDDFIRLVSSMHATIASARNYLILQFYTDRKAKLDGVKVDTLISKLDNSTGYYDPYNDLDVRLKIVEDWN